MVDQARGAHGHQNPGLPGEAIIFRRSVALEIAQHGITGLQDHQSLSPQAALGVANHQYAAPWVPSIL
jgi:hypothetical protein